ncbi:hypothetical protein KUH03_23715 [Sphingobacterium sp. E70]|uniref:hypothetical protein n=1 Tax=Sphingobacterium sp. E70 TaxID=2853439 RepID=UPI00211C9A8A|nr:hypothetical protein [Sphingobacterium sp. E70]ULT22415.1 hypothetical protein KUH03_23715 [Sphingobacterium sp. E70]
MLIISVYQMPTEVIPSIMIIATLVDPLATMLNATGDTVAAMLTTRLIGQRLSDTVAEKQLAVVKTDRQRIAVHIDAGETPTLVPWN